MYDEEVIALREQWFAQWLKNTPVVTADNIRQFHEFGGEGDDRIKLKMNRGGILQTVSITGIELLHSKAVMTYKDLVAGLESVIELNVI